MNSKVKRTRWRLWIYLTLGSFGFIGFWYVAKKIGDKRALQLGFIFLVVNIISGGTNLVFIQIACFFAQIYFAIEVNKRYLEFLGANPEVRKQKTERSVKKNENTSVNFAVKNDYLVEESHPQISEIKNVTPSSFAQVEVPNEETEPVENKSSVIPGGASQGLIDINNAPLDTLISSLDVDARTLTRVVSIRDQIGAFSSYEHLFKRADIRPHEMVKFRGRLSFGLIQGREEGIRGVGENSANRIVDL